MYLAAALDRSIAEVAHLVIPGRDIGEKPLTLYTAYLDESGTHKDSPLTVVAGFCGSVANWIAFESQWPALLDKHHLDVVHGKEITNKHGRAAIVADVVAALDEHDLFGIAAIVYEDEYRSVFPKGSKVPVLDTKYGLCFRLCMIKMANVITHRWPGQRISFVLEDGARNRKNALRIFELSKHGLSSFVYPLGNIALAGKKDYGALQAADLLAHSVHQSYLTGLVPHPSHTFLQLSGASTPFVVMYNNPEMMQTIRSRVAIVSRVAKAEKAIRKRLRKKPSSDGQPS